MKKILLKQKLFAVAIISCLLCALFLFLPNNTQAQVQKNYGNSLDNGFKKIIKDGNFYFTIGHDQINAAGLPVASVSRFDLQGNLLWTINLDIESVWNDAVLTNQGQLLVVGSTLPLDSTSQSLMGLVSENITGTAGFYTWLRRYDQPNVDYFTRVVKNPNPPDFFYPYYVLGVQTQSNSPQNEQDVVVLQMNAAGAILSKSVLATAGDDQYYRDILTLGASGDIMIAGNIDTGPFGKGIIYKFDNNVFPLGGVSIDQYIFNDISMGVSNGFIYATANENGTAHLLKFDSDLLLVWDVIIPQLSSTEQVWEDGSGSLFVTGIGNFGGAARTVIVKITENTPSIQWARYYNAGNPSDRGASWPLLGTNELAYTDTRVLPGGFGGDCAFLAINDLNLDNCMIVEDMVSLVIANPLPDGPTFPLGELYPIPIFVNLVGFASMWQQADVCNPDSCCTGQDAFCQALDNAVTISIDPDSCKAIVSIGDLGDCDIYIDHIDWGVSPPQQTQGPLTSDTMVMFEYPASGTYEICYLAIEVGSDGFICNEKFVCDTFDIVCDSCCLDFDAFCLAVETAFTVTVDNDSCKAIVNIGNLSDCDYYEYVDWGDGNQDNGPFDAGDMTMHVYAGSGTYVISSLAIEVGSDGFICFEKLISDTVTVVCDSCCLDFDAFCLAVETAFTVTVDNDSCKAIVNIGNLSDCDYYEYVDWGDGNQDNGPFDAGDMTMHVYAGSGTYVISSLAIEVGSDGFICFEKLISDTVTVVCDSCCLDFDAFCLAVETAFTVTVNNDSCKAIVNIGNLPDCDYYEYVDWGDGNQDNGPFDAGDMTMHVYAGSGTYVISSLAIEVGSDGFICFEKLISDTVTVVCTVGLGDLSLDYNINLSPNPTTEGITLHIEYGSLKNCQVEIIDLWGRTLAKQKLTPGVQDHKLSLATFAEGIYFVKITENGVPIWIDKIVKQ